MLHEVKDLLIAKYQQLNFLKQEINTLTIEEKLQNPKLQGKIKIIISQFSL